MSKTIAYIVVNTAGEPLRPHDTLTQARDHVAFQRRYGNRLKVVRIPRNQATHIMAARFID